MVDNRRRVFSHFDSAFFLRAAITVLILPLLAIAVSRVAYPFDTGNAEALSWIPAECLLAGENPYSLAFEPPFIMSAYGVVYYAAVAVGVKLFGLQLWWTRILSVFGFAVCLWAAAKITKRLTGNREAVLAAVLAGLAMFPAQMWIALMRSDLLAAAFAFVALCLAFTVREKDELRFRRVAFAALLAALAFFTKHTFTLPACFIFVRFAQIGEWRKAFSFAALFAALIGAGVFALDYGSAGGYVWQHFVHARDLPFAAENLRANFPASLKRPAFLFFAGFLLIFLYQKFKAFGAATERRAQTVGVLRSPRVLILLYFAASFAAAFLSSGRVGANVNYYIESSFAAAIICGFVCDWFGRSGFLKLSFALVVLLTLGGAVQLASIARGEYFRWQSLAYYKEIYRRAGELTARQPNPVCASVAPEIVLWNGCALEFIDYEEYETGWSPELGEIFERRIRSGRFAAIVWHNDRFAARFPNYRLVETKEKLPERFSPVFLYERVKE